MTLISRFRKISTAVLSVCLLSLFAGTVAGASSAYQELDKALQSLPEIDPTGLSAESKTALRQLSQSLTNANILVRTKMRPPPLFQGSAIISSPRTGFGNMDKAVSEACYTAYKEARPQCEEWYGKGNCPETRNWTEYPFCYSQIEKK